MHTNRFNRLAELTGDHSLDALALVPGPNLFYFTGFSFHLSERPILLLLFPDRAPALVAPGFEALKAESAPVEMEVFPYTDEQGHEPAFEAACAALGLAGRTIGAESLAMRLLEARLLEKYAPNCRIIPADDIAAALRMRKDERELAHMRQAIAITETALQATMQQTRAGMTELQVAAVLRAEMFQAGAETVAFIIVQGGPNSASPHAVPGDRSIRPGETILIDCGVTVGGYNSDITRTFSIGPLDEEMAQVYEIVQAANAAGRAHAGLGVAAEDVDRAARAVIEEAGYGEYFIHRTGHGLGLEVHEPPYIIAGNKQLLEPGMTFTVEPGIYLPGRGGVRIEDDVLVTPGGAESLTTFPRELVAL